MSEEGNEGRIRKSGMKELVMEITEDEDGIEM
jgi:hypothetical protein